MYHVVPVSCRTCIMYTDHISSALACYKTQKAIFPCAETPNHISFNKYPLPPMLINYTFIFAIRFF